jgi:isoquinoline 1-oxidoreductase alpha subunit
MAFAIKINGITHSADVDGDTPLLWVLRDVLGLTGTKFGCGMALCGACTVHIDGVASRSCITPIESVGNSNVTTIEAIGATAAGAKIQKVWLDREVVQCSYCQSGQIMSTAALLASNTNPSNSDIDSAMSAWDNGDFVKAVRDTGRKTLLIAGVWTSVCVMFPALDAKASGFNVYAVIDASGDPSELASRTTLARFIQAGVIPTSTNAVLSETHRTWNRPEAAELAKLYALVAPNYAAVIESYQKAQDVIKQSR